MALSHSPRIVTDGLVLCLDAGNTKSYVGSGTTWRNLGPTSGLTTTSQIGGIVNEGSSLTLTAPSGGVITSIDFASYGTPTGTYPNFSIGGCHASNSVSVVQGLALGRNSVTISASNGTFGDPCEGTVKKLAVVATTVGGPPALLNTPTYSSTNGGYLSFASASSQYATALNPGSLTNWTAEAMVRFTSSYGAKVAMVVGGQYDGVSNLNFSIGTINSPTNYNIAVGFFNGAWRNTTGINYALNTWFHITGTYDGSTVRQYTNGVQVDSLSYAGTPASGGEIRINRRWDDVVSSGNLFDSNIATVRIYNRALTAAEVSQNFNALRGRFGI
jgi:hypothetical protein